MLDRLLHRTHVVQIPGQSYRLRDKMHVEQIASKEKTPSDTDPASPSTAGLDGSVFLRQSRSNFNRR